MWLRPLTAPPLSDGVTVRTELKGLQLECINFFRHPLLSSHYCLYKMHWDAEPFLQCLKSAGHDYGGLEAGKVGVDLAGGLFSFSCGCYHGAFPSSDVAGRPDMGDGGF